MGGGRTIRRCRVARQIGCRACGLRAKRRIPPRAALPFGYRRDSSMVTLRVATTGAPSPVVAVVALAAILLTTFAALEDVEV